MTYSDSQTGTPVTLVVRPDVSTPGHVTPPPGHGPSHLPFSGVELAPALAAAALLIAAGSVLSAVRRPAPARARSSARR
jgi:hypothetical protein